MAMASPTSTPQVPPPTNSEVWDPLPEKGRTLGQWLYTGHLATVWGIAVSNNLLGLGLLFSLWKAKRPWFSWPRVAPLLFPLGLYVVFLLVSVLMSSEPAKSASELGELFSLTALPLGLLWLRSARQIRRVFDLLIAVAALLAAHGIWQYYFTEYGDLHRRIPGLFSHYLTYSGALLIGDLLLIARMVSGGAWRKPWFWIAAGLINYALLLSLSRSAWVALVLTLALYGLVRGRRYLLAYGAGVLLLVLLAPDSWASRMRSIADLSDSSNYDRICMLEAGLEMVAERPLFGLGPEMVKSRYPIYRHPSAPRHWVPHLHNTFLHLAAERGLTSLAAYLWLMLATLTLAVRGYRRQGSAGGPSADLYLGVILVLVGFNIAGLFEANWRDTELQRLVLFAMAVPICLDRPQGLPERTGEST